MNQFKGIYFIKLTPLNEGLLKDFKLCLHLIIVLITVPYINLCKNGKVSVCLCECALPIFKATHISAVSSQNLML